MLETIYSSNKFLNQNEMAVNAKYILDYLINEGWTKNAICALLGNAQIESTLNPGIWESLRQGNLAGGYGLLQWTPATKYMDWCKQHHLDPSSMSAALKRVLWEVRNNEQWVNPLMTFEQFTHSTLKPEELANLFLQHYERPLNRNQPDRAKLARYWFNNLENPAVNDSQQWVKHTGISYGDRPNDPATREEVWSMMHNLYKVMKNGG